MSLLTSYTRPATGGAQFDIVEPVDGRTFVSGTAAAAPANVAFLSKFRLAKAKTVTSITYFVGTASGNICLGIYQFASGTDYTLIGTTGSVAASGSSANQTVNLTASVMLVANRDYWLGFVADNGTITVIRQGGGNYTHFGGKGLQKTSSFPLPSTLSTPDTTGTTIIWMAAS